MKNPIAIGNVAKQYGRFLLRDVTIRPRSDSPTPVPANWYDLALCTGDNVLRLGNIGVSTKESELADVLWQLNAWTQQKRSQINRERALIHLAVYPPIIEKMQQRVRELEARLALVEPALRELEAAYPDVEPRRPHERPRSTPKLPPDPLPDPGFPPNAVWTWRDDTQHLQALIMTESNIGFGNYATLLIQPLRISRDQGLDFCHYHITYHGEENGAFRWRVFDMHSYADHWYAVHAGQDPAAAQQAAATFAVDVHNDMLHASLYSALLTPGERGGDLISVFQQLMHNTPAPTATASVSTNTPSATPRQLDFDVGAGVVHYGRIHLHEWTTRWAGRTTPMRDSLYVQVETETGDFIHIGTIPARLTTFEDILAHVQRWMQGQRTSLNRLPSIAEYSVTRPSVAWQHLAERLAARRDVVQTALDELARG